MISGFVDRCMPYKVRTSCGHVVIRQMRQATAGVPWSEEVELSAPGGMPCEKCQIKARVAANRAAGREPFAGLQSSEIGIYNRTIMFGDNDEAFPGDKEWSRIVD